MWDKLVDLYIKIFGKPANPYQKQFDAIDKEIAKTMQNLKDIKNSL